METKERTGVNRSTPIELDLEPFVRLMESRRDALTSARQRDNLSVCIEHMDAELVHRDLDRLMATLVDSPRYEIYGMGGTPSVLEGREAITAMYVRLFESDPNSSGFDLEGLIIDDDSVMIHGYATLTPSLALQRFPHLASEIDFGRPCILRKHVATVAPFRDGRMAGEIQFFDGPFGLRDAVFLD
jgi:hypothetical protein